MRIVYSPGIGPRVVDSRERLNTLYHQLNRFFAGAAAEVAIRAEISQGRDHAQELLKGLRVRKTRGPIALHLADDRWLELTGSAARLKGYVQRFHIARDERDSRIHAEDASAKGGASARTMDLVVEADDATCRRDEH